MEFKKPSEEEWDKIVKETNTSWLNSLSSWTEFFKKEFGYEDAGFGAYDPELICVVPLLVVKSALFGKRMISGAVLDNGGIIAPKALSPEQTKLITQHIVETARQKKCRHIEIRNPAVIPEGFEKSSKYSDFVMELTKDEKELIQSFDKKLRNGIRKAEKLLKIEKCTISEGIDEFYKMHLKTMQFLSSPPMPKQFYSRMGGFIMFASINGKKIAAVMINMFRTDAKYEASAYLPEFRELQPNSLLVYKALIESRREGMKKFFFGRTQTEGSVRDFKKRWNAEEKPLDYFYKIFKGKIPADARKSPLAKLAFIWKISPAFLTRIFGPYFRKKLAM